MTETKSFAKRLIEDMVASLGVRVSYQNHGCPVMMEKWFTNAKEALAFCEKNINFWSFSYVEIL